VYYLDVNQLRLQCASRNLNTEGGVRQLRQRLVDFVRSNAMGGVDMQHGEARGESGSTQDNGVPPVRLETSEGLLNVGRGDHSSVLIDLLRQVPPLLSERPEDILFFFIRLGEIHSLGLVQDRVFITRILPLFPRGLLQFLTGCLRERSDWATCKSRILQEYFPYFVRERLIRNLIVFNFHQRDMQVRIFIDQIFQAAEFLSYAATEQQLVERIVMNLHPQILKATAFLNPPHTREELCRVVTQIEERFSVADERRRIERETHSNDGRGESPDRPDGYGRDRPPRKLKCWHCGRMGHVRNKCPNKTGIKYGKSPRAPSGKSMASLGKVEAFPADAPLWVMVGLKRGKIPALLDTGAQSSCIRSDIAEFLLLAGETRVFKTCSINYVLANGTQCKVEKIVKLRVKILGFSWDHPFHVLEGGLFPAILGLDFMGRTGMTVNVSTKQFKFEFAPHLIGECGTDEIASEGGNCLQSLLEPALSEINNCQNPLNGENLAAEFPGLFSPILGTAKCEPYDIELSDKVPVRSPPYRCAPPENEDF